MSVLRASLALALLFGPLAGASAEEPVGQGAPVPASEAAAGTAREAGDGPGAGGAAAPGRRGPPEGLLLRLDGRAETALEARFDDRSTRGRLRHDRLGLTFAPGWGLADGAGLVFVEAAAEWTNYDLGARGLAPGAPGGVTLDDAWQLDLGVGARLRLSERWGLLLLGGVRGAAEDGRLTGDALTARAIALAEWTVTDRLTLGFGLLFRTRLEENPLPILALGFDWRPIDELRLRVRGPGVELSWLPSPEVELTLAARWELREYRLARDHPVARGVLRDRHVPVELRLAWQPIFPVLIEARAGVSLGRRLELDDERGRRVGEGDLRPQPFVGLAFTLRF